jgi:hypothetical protein
LTINRRTTLRRSPGDPKNRPLLYGNTEEKDAFVMVAQADITALHLCQTIEQARRKQHSDLC